MNEAEYFSIRRKARSDLFYLATEILGYALVPEVHRPITSFFLNPDPDKGLYEQEGPRSRLLLDPRGHFKTTIDIAHAVQLILNFPDIRILLVSGAKELAERMLKEVRFHFQANDKLRRYFPEFGLSEKTKGTTTEFTSPARTNGRLREPTITISTIDSIKAGSHYDVIKFDDVVNEVNSQNKEQIQKCIDGFNHLVPILEPGGFKDVIGTRYNYSDLYGWIIDNNDGEWAIMQRTAIELPMTKSSKVLFPKDAKGQERFSYKILKKIKDDDPYLFSCQYLNDPSDPDDAHFTRNLLEKHFIPISQVVPLFSSIDLMGRRSPRPFSVYCAWDLAFSEKKYADYSCGVAVLFDARGRMIVIDLVLGRFTAHELLQQIILMAMRWRIYLSKVIIENAGGSKLLEPAIFSEMQRLNWHFPIEWVPVNPKATKNERIFGAHPLLVNNELYFSNQLDQTDASNSEKLKEELIKQYTRFPHYSHDDIPDCISMLLPYKPMVELPPTVPIPVPLEEEYTINPLGYGFIS